MSDERSMSGAHVSRWFGEVMLHAAEAAGAKVSEARVRSYALDLAAYPRQAVEQAFRQARLRGSGFFPSTAELVRFIEPTLDDRAVMAWDALTRAAEDVGSYRPIVIEDGAAADALVETFGTWAAFCGHEKGPDLLVKRQAFLARYRDALRRGTPPQPRVLPGLLGGATAGESGLLALDCRVEIRTDRLLDTTDVKQLNDGDADGQETEG